MAAHYLHSPRPRLYCQDLLDPYRHLRRQSFEQLHFRDKEMIWYPWSQILGSGWGAGKVTYKQGEPRDWNGVQTLKAMYRSEIKVLKIFIHGQVKVSHCSSLSQTLTTFCLLHKVPAPWNNNNNRLWTSNWTVLRVIEKGESRGRSLTPKITCTQGSLRSHLTQVCSRDQSRKEGARLDLYIRHWLRAFKINSLWWILTSASQSETRHDFSPWASYITV